MRFLFHNYQALKKAGKLLALIWKRVLYLGTGGMKTEELHSVRVTNLLALLAFPLCILNGLLWVFVLSAGSAFTVVYILAIGSCYTLTLFWSYCRLSHIAKVWLYAVYWFDMVFSSSFLFGPESSIQWHFLLAFPIAFLVWPEGSGRQRYIMLGITMLLFVLVANWQGEPLTRLNPNQQKLMEILSFFNTAVLLGFTAYLFVSDTTEARRKLKHFASHDALTGILNRGEFERRVIHQLSMLTEGAPRTLIIFDLDNFKGINDKWGHAAGDDALKHLVSIVNPIVAGKALFARLGGDEFCIFCTQINQGVVVQMAEQIMSNLAKEPCHYNGESITVSSSIGIAFETRRYDLQRIFLMADDAMYTAKRKGKGRIIVNVEEVVREIQTAR